jgi:hypothetical protein
VTFDEVKKAFLGLSNSKGREACQAVLTQFGSPSCRTPSPSSTQPSGFRCCWRHRAGREVTKALLALLVVAAIVGLYVLGDALIDRYMPKDDDAR